MAQIKIGFQDTINKASQLKDYSTDVKKCCNSLNEINSNLNSGWKGNSGNEYRRKLSQVTSKIFNRTQKLAKTANEIDKAARRFKQVEEIGLQIFKR